MQANKKSTLLTSRCVLLHMKYQVLFDFKNTGYVFCLKKSKTTANYPVISDFKNTGYLKSSFTTSFFSNVSNF